MINAQAKKKTNGQTTRNPWIEHVCEKNQERCQTAHNTFRFIIHNDLSLGEVSRRRLTNSSTAAAAGETKRPENRIAAAIGCSGWFAAHPATVLFCTGCFRVRRIP